MRKIADNTPDARMINARSWRGVRASFTTRLPTSSKKPASRRFTLRIIMAKSSVSVFRSSSPYASSSEIAPMASSNVAPASAIVARFIRKKG